MITPRRGFSVTLLRDGKVLVAGGDELVEGIDTASAELYDPGSGTWTATGSMTTPRSGQTATLLPDGKVLAAGGGWQADQWTRLASAELYDPAGGTWTATGSMAGTRLGGTATLLGNGTVLVAGGLIDFVDFPGNDEGTASAELYDSAAGTWTATGSMLTQHFGHTATLLPDGRVLVAGGACCGAEPNPVASAEIYDPGSGSWAATGSMGRPRVGHAATLLLDGKVLVTGGNGEPSTAEMYDPSTGTWTLTGTLGIPGAGAAAVLLPDGNVLVAGGWDRHANEGWGVPLATAELYNPGSGIWTPTASMLAPIADSTATLLRDGMVLVFVAGGERNGTWAELYDPGSP